MTIQGDNEQQQHGHMARDEQSCPCTKPTKTLLKPCPVAEPGDLLLHMLFPLLSYSSRPVLDVPLHSDPEHAPLGDTHSSTFSPHHPPCILCVIIQTAHSKDHRISNTTIWLHYTFNVLYKLLEVSLKDIPPKRLNTLTTSTIQV